MIKMSDAKTIYTIICKHQSIPVRYCRVMVTAIPSILSFPQSNGDYLINLATVTP